MSKSFNESIRHVRNMTTRIPCGSVDGTWLRGVLLELCDALLLHSSENEVDSAVARAAANNIAPQPSIIHSTVPHPSTVPQPLAHGNGVDFTAAHAPRGVAPLPMSTPQPERVPANVQIVAAPLQVGPRDEAVVIIERGQEPPEAAPQVIQRPGNPDVIINTKPVTNGGLPQGFQAPLNAEMIPSTGAVRMVKPGTPIKPGDDLDNVGREAEPIASES